LKFIVRPPPFVADLIYHLADMHIRNAQLSDMDAIYELDHSFITDHVWQQSSGGNNAELQTIFRLAKLPRQISVPFPHDARALQRCLHRCDFVWVALDTSHEVVGYLGMTMIAWQNTGWIPVLAVAPKSRRQGIATKLLQVALSQAKQERAHSITLDVPTKNYPATQFCLARGFRFAGFADNYYDTHDIALFFSHRIR
jgi:ribosomal protein S18 acetylase RimI-like enzyme